MHSIWQEQMDFPVYPILKRDKKADILYVGATLRHAVEAHFQKETGKAVMIIEEKSIANMPELGGMGVLKATNMNEFKDLCILRNYIINHQIKHVVCGFDFHFGKKGMGDVHVLQENKSFDVTVIEEYSEDALKVSSSYIKKLLNEGNIEKANHLLTRFYRVSGQVIYGLQNGRKIGFPTANIDYGHYVVLKKGVYGVYITIKGKQYKGMANIGYNPTVGLIDNLSLEVNIFDFDQDIYGEDVDVDFVFRVRDEKKFKSLNHLKEQLQKDKKHIDQFLD